MSTASGEPAAAPPSSPLANEELEEEGVRADIGVFADDRVGQIEDTADENGSIHREEDDVDEDPFTDRPHGILARTFKKIITGVLRSVPSTPARGGDDSDGEAGETPEEGEERDDNGDAPPEAAEVERISAPTEEAVKVDERKNLDLLPMALRTRSRDRDPVSSKELRSVKETTPAAHQRTGMSVTHSQDSRPGSVRTENINLEDLDSIEVDRLTYKQLQHVCKHHKLVANGKKVVLRQRLKNYINKQRKVDHMSTRNTEQEIREVSPKVAVDQAFHGRYEEDGMSRVDTSGPAKILRPMTTRKRTRDVGSIEPVITGENSIQKSQDGTVREDNKDPQGDLIGSGLNYVVEISSAVKRQRKSITASEFEVFTRVLLDGVHSEDRDQAVDTLNKLYQKASPTPRKQKLSVEDAHALTKEHGEALAQHATQMDTQMLTGEGQSSLPPSSAERLKGRPKTLQPRTRHVEQMVTQQRASPKKKPTVESREEMIDAVSPVEFEFRTPTSQRQNVPSSIAPIVSEANVSPRPGPRILKSSETAEPEATPVKSTQDGYPGGHAEKARFSNSRRTPRKTAGNIVEEFLQSSSTFIPKSADRAGEVVQVTGNQHKVQLLTRNLRLLFTEANGFVDGGFTFEKGTSARGPRRSRRRPPSRVSLGQWRKKTEIREPEHVQYSDLRGSYMSPVSKEVVFSASSKRIMASLEKLSTPQVGSKRSRTTNFGEGSGPYTEPKMQTRRELSNKPLQPGALFINSPVDEDEREQVAEESVHVHEAEPESRLQRIRRQAMMRIAENKATAVNAKPIYVPEPDEPDEARDKLAEALKQKSEKPAANMVGSAGLNCELSHANGI
uniref:SAP domain-containing protein n=1 Tax=Rhodosorus marinus TaxID=101924 RepID=A0A7S3A9T1_9RHOD|mmetsp:Transcript_8438/g.37667  ORF Transcript_8438/g.37667 Transcript_8438/m.37667 type:complete len:844 (+) Transcript_8438:318-2849(+)